MPIINMKKFAELRRQGDSTATARRELLEIHQENVLKQIKELESNLTKSVKKSIIIKSWRRKFKLFNKFV